jgi:TM2 domain-containing membrane protein YozV
MSAGAKSKTLAAWLALVGGAFGLHRFYLHGLRDGWGWLHPLPALLGLYGVQRALQYGLDDQLSWALIPLLGLVIAAAMLAAIVYALMPDEKWDARYNAGGPASHSGWAAIIAAVLALLIGATVLMATLAFSGQRYFEYQIESGVKRSR